MRKNSGVAIALEVVYDVYCIITSDGKACGYKVYWMAGKFFEEKTEKTEEFCPLKDLLTLT